MTIKSLRRRSHGEGGAATRATIAIAPIEEGAGVDEAAVRIASIREPGVGEAELVAGRVTVRKVIADRRLIPTHINLRDT